MRKSLLVYTNMLLMTCAVLIVSAVSVPAATASTIPSPLSFYQSAPSGWQSQPVGTLLKWQYEPASCSALNGLTGYRVMYVSTGALGAKVFETGMVYFPTSGTVPAAGRPVVAWDHGTSGVGDSAAPSRYPWLYPEPVSDPWDWYAQWVGGVGRQGYIVTCPDYEGLGTPGLHTYLNAAAEGTATIDAVRAARQLASTLGVRASTRWGVSGASQGGQAALAAAEMASTYGKGLSLQATVAVAPAVELGTIIPGSATDPIGYPYIGYVAWGIKAICPSFNFATFCGSWILPVINQAPDCYFDQWWDLLLSAHLDANGDPLAPGPGQAVASGWNKTAGYKQFLAAANVESTKATGSVLVLQGDQDEDGLYQTLGTLTSKLKAVGDNLQVVVLAGADHDGAVLAGLPYAQAFFSSKLPVN